MQSNSVQVQSLPSVNWLLKLYLCYRRTQHHKCDTDFMSTKKLNNFEHIGTVAFISVYVRFSAELFQRFSSSLSVPVHLGDWLFQ
jgi:hypothetical protein